MLTFHGESIERGLLELQKAERIVGHNVIDFDLPALKKLYGFTAPLHKVLDTLVVSRCVFPDLRNDDWGRNKFDKELVGSHSLKAWGHRMGSATKLTYGEQDDAFEEYNEEMRKYCERDVIVTQLLYDYLFKQDPSREMIAIEHWFRYIVTQQERHGFKFNLDKADVLTAKLMGIRAKLTTDLQNAWKPTKVEMKSPAGWALTTDQATYQGKTKNDIKLKLKEAGEVQALVKNAVKTGNAVKEIPFNPGSRKQIAERLMALGYELPTENDGKTYKVDEAVLKGIDHPIAEELLSFLLVQKRLGQLAEGQQAWLKLQKNGVIHGRVNTNGAVTGRCTHSTPNVAQVPSVRADYGKECRELFTVRNGYKLVGCDASGLELRMLAHYMAFYDGGEYAKIVTEGDVHTVNQKAAGLETRDQAKTMIYALLYGAGDHKMGEIIGGGAMEGQQLKRKFFSSLPALARLQADVQRKTKAGGELKGLDGRILPVRSTHAALNMLLQSAGAVVMKVALIQLFHKLNQLKWQHGREYAFVANIHDEFQAEVLPDKAQTFGVLAVESMAAAGRQLKLNVALDGEFKIGNNWAETH
jgi:DNA polymerase I-like protein with 3'-5' exonuclease and polymerase domains